MDIFLKVFCGRLVVELKKAGGGTPQFYYQDLLRLIQRELYGKTSVDMFHNKYLNYPTSEDPTIHIPSRFYYLKYILDCANINFDEPVEADDTPAECVFQVSWDDGLSTLLNALVKIQKYQQVLTSHFDATENEMCPNYNSNEKSYEGATTLFKQAVKFRKKIHICRMSDFACPFVDYTYLAQQLHDCNKLEELQLVWNDKSTPVPMELADIIATMTSLEDLTLQGFERG